MARDWTHAGRDREPASGSPTRRSRYLALTRAALRLYPRAWRERYADEVLELLEQHRVTLWTVLDVLLGAVDAHLRRDLLPERLTSMAHRIRTSEISIFVAFVLFCLAWVPLRFVRDPLPVWEDATRAHPEVWFALAALDVCGVVATLAILAGGVPMLVAAIGGAVRARHWGVLLLFAVPVLALAALIGFGALALPASTARQSSAPDAPLTVLAVILQFALLLAALLAVALSTVAVARGIARSSVGARVLRFALLPGGIATVAICAGLIAALALLTLITLEAPEVGTWPPIEVGIALLMLAAAVLAVVALRRGLAARSGGE